MPCLNGKGGLAAYVPQVENYVMSECQRVVDWGRKKGIDICFFYGDLSETRMSYESILAFTSFIRKNKDIQFVAYLGNHDKVGRDSSEGHSLQVIQAFRLKNLKIVENDTYLEFGRHKVKVCPWPSTDFDPQCLNFGHVEVYGAKTDSGRLMEGELKKIKAVVCMGHLHTPHRVRNVHYSGTLYQTNFGESLPKGFHHIEWTSVDDHEIHLIPFEPRIKLHNCVVESQSDIDSLPRGRNELIKLVVKDGADVSVPDWPNIVISKVFKTRNDLVQILTEDLMHGHELEYKTSDSFREWIKAQTINQKLKRKVVEVRKRVLTGV